MQKKISYAILVIISFFSINIAVEAAIYECDDSDFTLFGNMCIKSEKAYRREGVYYCDPGTQKGATVRDGNCVWEVPAREVDNSENSETVFTCSTGQISYNGECYIYSGSASNRSGVYYCSVAGEEIIGTSCYKKVSLVPQNPTAPTNPTEPTNPVEPEISNLDDVTCGGITDIPKEVPQIFSLFIDIIKIITPVGLVIKGILDLYKATMSSKEEDITKSRKMFFKRLGVGAIVFLVIALSQFLFGLVANNSDKAGLSDCLNCFLNNECTKQ